VQSKLLASVLVGTAVALTTAAPAVGAAPKPVAGECHAFLTPPVYRGEVPTPQSRLGQPLGAGQQRDVTTAESDAYLRAVSAASPRVVDGTLATSIQGRPLRYAIIGKPINVTDTGLARIRAAAAALQDPRLSQSAADKLAHEAPAILWVEANVHGDEEGGTDAALKSLYELADRDDCVVRRILDNAIVVIVPTQNPDGREADTRQNAYGFNMNRDWFARTQPETDGKLELMRRYPPVLAIDDHEMPIPTMLFPPVADPVYHEIARQPMDWSTNVFGRSIQDEFDRQQIPYFNSQILDLLYMGYGDTVPIVGFGAAGMTFEKYQDDTVATRVYQHFAAQWTSFDAAARTKLRILAGWHDLWREAAAQGAAGQLEPNEVVQPENVVQFPVPDERVRHYFIRADEPNRAVEVQRLVRRLQRMDVEVRRLSAPLQVPDYKPYGRARRAVTLPAGTYWISMAQRQKHWIQAMLNEDPYVPFPYFYDISAWSQPLLLNLDSAGRSGALLSPRSTLVSPLPEPDRSVRSSKRIGLWQFSQSVDAIESAGPLRFQLDRVWRLPHTEVTTAGVKSGQLAGLDVLVLPDGAVTPELIEAIGEDGAAALRQWVEGGGRLVAWTGGVTLAAQLGLTSATIAAPTPNPIPGSLVRANVAPGSPLAAGVGGEVWVMNVADNLLTASSPGQVAVSYPEQESGDFFISGYYSATNAEDIDGTAAVVDEPRGAGRFVGFASDPTFRGLTDGTAKLALNALVGPDPLRVAPAAATAAAVTAAQRAAQRLPLGAAYYLQVRPQNAARAARVLRRHGARLTVRTIRGETTFRIANPRRLSAEQHPWILLLPGELRREGVKVTSLVAL
jgi:hypothetical protein